MNIFQMLLGLLQSLVSPALRELLTSLLNDWETSAKKTPSPVDDIIVASIKTLVGIK